MFPTFISWKHLLKQKQLSNMAKRFWLVWGGFYTYPWRGLSVKCHRNTFFALTSVDVTYRVTWPGPWTVHPPQSGMRFAVNCDLKLFNGNTCKSQLYFVEILRNVTFICRKTVIETQLQTAERCRLEDSDCSVSQPPGSHPCHGGF